MTAFTLEPQYLFKLYSKPRGFATDRPVYHTCNVPAYTLVVDFIGNCLLCDCDGWLPLPVGKVDAFKTIEEIFSSSQAQAIIKDVEDQKFSWCAVDDCGIRHHSKNKKQLDFYLNVDESCNLHCPSCRRHKIMINHGPEFDQKLIYIDRIKEWLDLYDKPIRVTLSGNGDPLASHLIRPLIKNWTPNPKQTFNLMTNGLLIKKQLHDLPILQQVESFNISVDAGSATVYENVRPPGNWHILLENFEYLKSIDKQSITTLKFALQNKNFQDLENFAAVCEKYGFVGQVHHLDDWGTWSIMRPENPDPWTIKHGIFGDHDVLNEQHPNHYKAKKIVLGLLDHPHLRFVPYLRQKISPHVAM